jgi:hypothetical protein|tara:strand:- start:1305 stop:1640 length:336 start_codon:yes stop_codon:yes gene_type:complete
MTKEISDTLNPKTLVLEDNIPLPKDRRGIGEKLPSEMKELMSSMKIGQSFFIETTVEDQKSKIGAVRASISRYMNSVNTPIAGNWLFSVRQENEPFRVGIRVFRMEDRVDT